MRIAALLIICLWAAVSAAGCNPAARRARVEGDTVYMPAASSMMRYERAKPDQLPYVRFNSAYPLEWPDAGELPPDSYLRKSASLEGRRDNYGYFADFDGVCRGNPDDVMADWLDRINAERWITSFTDSEKKGQDKSGINESFLQVYAHPSGTYGMSVHVTVFRHTNMDGWVHFNGYVSVENRYLF